MIDLVKLFVALGAGYLLGSISTAVLVGKMYGKDIREYGSKSAGLTNTLRVLGKPAALIVLVGDILKGVAACLVGLYLGVYAGSGTAVDSVSMLLAGAGAIVGHNWPVFFGFRGGKGVLTAAAVLFMLDPIIALSCLSSFVVIVAATRFVSLGSICAALLFVVLSFIPVFGHTIYFQIFAIVMAFMVVAKHRANIGRLLSGTENKLRFKSGKPSS
ncbi:MULTISPECIES: glycerol-3-phosphate 1-O-acyltransferase PlsY [unclassified Pseudovibrio]|uniref:glycerol-3-phosphate 1-O-acyltransferase PlsY n=1 Tax=unclassified Pseudovibrio TaxID=2627060 RepID=UPI0007AE4E29|nr:MULTISPECIES: glycerol-3-phosphate 1-O-acyltransferase PlsY [unclassified Pseudovibrio]KZK98182.1 Glycerol-3-phosphate acyltransferase [Pseudovibrio sp. W74]KZL04136.1 Glycerol-3-phosphate acyltransferase [Pseudovibrio sp. Ad14]